MALRNGESSPGFKDDPRYLACEIVLLCWSNSFRKNNARARRSNGSFSSSSSFFCSSSFLASRASPRKKEREKSPTVRRGACARPESGTAIFVPVRCVRFRCIRGAEISSRNSLRPGRVARLGSLFLFPSRFLFLFPSFPDDVIARIHVSSPIG